VEEDKKEERETKKRENFFVCDELGFRMFQRERHERERESKRKKKRESKFFNSSTRILSRILSSRDKSRSTYCRSREDVPKTQTYRSTYYNYGLLLL